MWKHVPVAVMTTMYDHQGPVDLSLADTWSTVQDRSSDHRNLTLHYHHLPVPVDPASIEAAWSRVHVGSLLTRETAASAPRYDGTSTIHRNDDRLLAPLVAVVA